jgi:hypothetical protein
VYWILERNCEIREEIKISISNSARIKRTGPQHKIELWLYPGKTRQLSIQFHYYRREGYAKPQGLHALTSLPPPPEIF